MDTHGSELEVIYALSGWLKDNPQTYHIKLASGLKLAGKIHIHICCFPCTYWINWCLSCLGAEVKHEFVDNCSVQVYSVQACIPQDSALLWNAEFVQAEEFFNQPLTAENCLRDNRSHFLFLVKTFWLFLYMEVSYIHVMLYAYAFYVVECMS